MSAGRPLTPIEGTVRQSHENFPEWLVLLLESNQRIAQAVDQLKSDQYLSRGLGKSLLQGLIAQNERQGWLTEQVTQLHETVKDLREQQQVMSDRYYELYPYVGKMETDRRLQAIVAGNPETPIYKRAQG